ncbi:MAG: hypothetical protein AAF918_08125 [Pseudomonadota bacterium]
MFLKLLLTVATILAVLVWVRLATQLPRRGPGERGKPRRKSTTLSREQAAEVLGVPPDADRKTVLDAHRRLIRANHPDRGGSDFLARQINSARDKLLE